MDDTLEFRIAAVVHRAISTILTEHGVPNVDVRGGERLGQDLGLSSLELVGLLSRVNADLGTPEFEGFPGMSDETTADDLCRAYRRHLSRSPGRNAHRG